ncbi:MAG: GNAT family N-acetyltransferase [Phycisphaerales bacterium]|nr:MAG: GNAT family N-acetyltransferase [Phycisphaerales bacterium]
MGIDIREFVRGDIEFALLQTKREGWDATTDFFEKCLAHDPHGCFIAEIAGDRAGMITTACYTQSGWIGNLIVPPEQRFKGIGAALMAQALEYLSTKRVETFRLEADPAGIKLYRRLGFVDEFESLRFLRDGKHRSADAKQRAKASQVQPCAESDISALCALDAEYFGDDRGRMLSLMHKDAQACYVRHSTDGIDGYAFALSSAAGIRIGPWVAQSRTAANNLLEAILTDHGNKTLVAGVPDVNSQAVALLKRNDFHETPSSLRMVRGKPAAVGRPEGIYAIGGGAMG